ncbi:hypothetical protein ATANTOWER_021711 [Ataeniobius toweri]|uniref:Uncharacterized protein n=1 Tax=Ataeniobius toweri TaxID=208326 RepID=A0ABU7B1K4_9TELE|nr:hypothetical protein [Ataeniobius toweri]
MLNLCVIFCRQKPEPLIIFVEHCFRLQRFLDDQVYLGLVDFVWISFPRMKLAASCYSPTPEPRQKRTLSTLQCKYLNKELFLNSPVLTLQLKQNHLDYPTSHSWVPTPSIPGNLTAFVYWRIYPFMSLTHCCK